MSQFLFKHRNYGFWSIIFICLFLVGSIFSFFLFDVILAQAIPRIMNLRLSSKERRVYVNPPFPLTYTVFVFHVLNRDEVQNGGEPHFKEIGPYVFDEHLRKENIIDDDIMDTMEYDDIRTYIFRPDMSKNLTGNEIITTMHPVLISIGLTVHYEFRQFMHVAKAAIKEIFHEPTDVFWTGRVMDLLFHGILIDCDVTNSLAKIACSEIRKRNDTTFKPLDNGKLLFSMFGGQNNTSNGRWKIYRGVKNIHEAGYAAAVNGKTKVTVWGDEKPNEKCSQIIGTDGILVTPFRKKDEGLTFFARQLCATVHMNFKRKYSYRGIDCHVFEFKFEDLMNNMSCFCRESRECPLKGTMDLFPCVQAPVIVSHPHFLWGDPSLLANIGSGLSPVESKHEFVFNVEVNAGIDVNPYARVQVNFDLEPVKEIQVMSKLPKMVYPLIWIEESANIPDNMINLLKFTVTAGKKFHSFATWVTMTIFLFGAISCSTLYLLKKFSNFDIFEVEKTFKKSPNAISKIIPISTISNEAAFNANKEEIIERSLEQSADINERNAKKIDNTNAMLFLSEVVEDATKASRFQQQKVYDEQEQYFGN